MQALHLSKFRRAVRSFLDCGDFQTAKVTRPTSSKAMAGHAARRLAFDNPAQAIAYDYGYLNVVELKERARTKLKASFKEKCFNDMAVSCEIIPLDTPEKRIDAELYCS